MTLRQPARCRDKAVGKKYTAWWLGLLVCTPATHAITTQSFQVSASIVAGCQVSSGSGGVYGTLNFGSYSGTSSAAAQAAFTPNGALSIACTPGVALSMSIDGGQHYTTQRRLVRSGGTDAVPYRLYSNSNLSAASEIGVNQNVSVSYSNSNNITLPIYGVAQLTGFSPAGTYTDQLSVTLSW